MPARFSTFRPKVKAKLYPTEHEEQVLLFQWAAIMANRRPDVGLLFAIPNFSGRLGNAPPIAAIRQAQKLNAEGRKKGVPDVFLPVPCGVHHGLFLEMKRANAKPSEVAKEQRTWHASLRSMGYRVEVCRGWEAARDAITEYLNLPRAA